MGPAPEFHRELDPQHALGSNACRQREGRRKRNLGAGRALVLMSVRRIHMTTRSSIVVLALSAFGVLAFSSLSASAAIVCNNAGYCWHTPRMYAYPPGAHVIIHPNHWHWGRGEHFVWREHPGAGYWRGGVWVTLP
jgi:hypothetical protein